MLTGLGKVTYTVKVTQQRTTENAGMAQPQSAATIFAQNKTMLFASVGLKSLVRDLTVLDDFITDYDSIFSFEEEEYQDNIDNPGDIKVTCDYTELEKQFVQNKTKALKQTYTTRIDKPGNNLDLSEWLSGIDENSFYQQLDTKDNDFDWGFCLMDEENGEGSPYSIKNRKDWMNGVSKQMSDLSINNLCVLVPAGEAGGSYTVGGKQIHFVPTTKHHLNSVRRKTADNEHMRSVNFSVLTRPENGPIPSLLGEGTSDGGFAQPMSGIAEEVIMSSSEESTPAKISGEESINLNSAFKPVVTKIDMGIKGIKGRRCEGHPDIVLTTLE